MTGKVVRWRLLDENPNLPQRARERWGTRRIVEDSGIADLARYRLMMKTPAQAELGRGTRQVYASLGVTRKSRSFASLRMTILVSPSSRKGREKWARRGRENPQPPAKSAGRVGHL